MDERNCIIKWVVLFAGLCWLWDFLPENLKVMVKLQIWGFKSFIFLVQMSFLGLSFGTYGQMCCRFSFSKRLLEVFIDILQNASLKIPLYVRNWLWINFFYRLIFHLKTCQWINVISYFVSLDPTVALKQEYNPRLGLDFVYSFIKRT